MNKNPIHDWMINHLKQKLSREYDEVKINLEGEQKHEFKGHYPDLILSNHGLELAVVEVETIEGITSEKADEWSRMVGTGPGVKLIIMIPRASKAKVIDLLWKIGIADRTAVGSYDLNVQMP